LVFLLPEGHTGQEETFMKNVASRTGISVAVLAAAMAVVCAFFVPYGYPWPSLAWAVLACAVALGVAKSSIRPNPRMSDVIGDVEAESSRVPAAREREVVSTRAVW
jgi:hypothetical protein